MIYSVLFSTVYTIIFLYFYIGESDYRQGLDYNILGLHIINTIVTYVLFIILINNYILVWYYNFRITNLRFLNTFATYSSTGILLTGGIWSWSQWGTIEIYDVKILISFLFFFLFLTVTIVTTITNNIFKMILVYNFYVLYHIPILKYNVLWNSEIHQKNTFYLLEFFTVRYNGLFILLILYCYIQFFIASYLYNIKKQKIFFNLS